MRRCSIAIWVIALTGGAAVSTSAGAAHAATHTNVTGPIECTITGAVHFKPALVNGGAVPTKVTTRGTMSNCVNSLTGTPPAPGGITGGKVHTSFMLPTNDCAVYLGQPSHTGGPSAGKAKWTAPAPPAPIAPTSFTTGSSEFTLGSGNLDGALVSALNPEGSFHLVIVVAAFTTMSTADETTHCLPKTKGVAGSGGLKHMPFSDGAYVNASSCSPALC
jgi:hypothetical protein